MIDFLITHYFVLYGISLIFVTLWLIFLFIGALSQSPLISIIGCLFLVALGILDYQVAARTQPTDETLQEISSKKSQIIIDDPEKGSEVSAIRQDRIMMALRNAGYDIQLNPTGEIVASLNEDTVRKLDNENKAWTKIGLILSGLGILVLFFFHKPKKDDY